MQVNKWYVDTTNLDVVVIRRVHDELSILAMTGEELTREQQEDVAQQIVDDWNFSCDELTE